MEQVKKVRKTPIRFSTSLTQEQKKAKETILNNVVTSLIGEAGTGKTSTAVQIGLDMLFSRQVQKLIIIRPAVTVEEDLGHLPGSLAEKIEVFLAPVTALIKKVYDHPEKITKEINAGKIQMMSIAHLRGHNFENCFVLVDEAQNLKMSQIYTVLTRICVGSKVVLCGDLKQKDLKGESGLSRYLTNLASVKGCANVELMENHRDPIIAEIIRKW